MEESELTSVYIATFIYLLLFSIFTMLSRVSVKIKLKRTPVIDRTLFLYKKCLQFCVNQAWRRKIRNNIKLHPFVYQNIKDKGLQSQLAVACIKQACGIVKKAKSKPVINRCSLRYNFPRSASFKDNVLSLATIKGRVKIPFSVPDCFKEYFTWDVTESLLMIDRKDRCYFIFTFSKEVTPRDSTQHSSLGIDFGINNLAVTSDGRFYNSCKVKQAKRKFKFLRSKLQAKGTKSARRLLKKISGRERRFMANVNHCISKNIVSNYNGNKIVMENLKGIRKIRRGKRMNYWISNWSFFQLQSFVQYKAERLGVKVVKVNPFMTSQICHRCGQIGSRSSGCFSCDHCSLV